MSKIRILFITHETSRTGAPILILEFIKWIRRTHDVEPMIIINRKGVLNSEFTEAAKTHFWYERKISINRSLGYKIYTRIYNSSFGRKIYDLQLKRKVLAKKPDLIYSNTIGNGEIIEFLNFLNAKVISHVHEGEYIINYLGKENLEQVKKRTDHFIACSRFVQNTLVDKFGFKKSSISLIYESIKDSSDIHPQALQYDDIARIKKNGGRIIGGSGGLGWRKGTDFIIPLMREMVLLRKHIFYVWVGGEDFSDEYQKLRFDINIAGLSDNILLIKSVPNPIDYYLHFDVFVLLSREDPFPLVCLENGLLKKPVLCFEGSGGIPELLEDEQDNIIPYSNFKKMAERINYLLENKEISENIGTALREKILKNFTTDTCFPQMYGVITSLLGNSLNIRSPFYK